MTQQYADAVIAVARQHKPGGNLVSERAVSDATLASELVAIVDGRPTPSAGNAHTAPVQAALLRVYLGGSGAAVGQGQPWENGTPDHGGKVLAVINLPSAGGASRSCTWLVYQSGAWSSGLGDAVLSADVIGWLDLVPGDRFLPYIMGPGWQPAAWSEEV